MLCWWNPFTSGGRQEILQDIVNAISWAVDWMWMLVHDAWRWLIDGLLSICLGALSWLFDWFGLMLPSLGSDSYTMQIFTIAHWLNNVIALDTLGHVILVLGGIRLALILWHIIYWIFSQSVRAFYELFPTGG